MLIGCMLSAAIFEERPPNDVANGPVPLWLLSDPWEMLVVGPESRPWKVELRTDAALGGRIGRLGRK
jgi:hypothetical protein